MIQIVFGKVGFYYYHGTLRGNQHSSAFIVLCGIVGFVWWNSVAAKTYHRCMHLSLKDAAMISDSPRLIRERVDAAMKEERKRWEEWEMWSGKERSGLMQSLTEERTKIHRLETTIQEMMRLSESPNDPPCEACGLPVSDEENVGHECNLHPECAEEDQAALKLAGVKS